jgi:magnesium chelatase family protein
MAACGISEPTTRWLGDTADQLMLSARAIHKTLRVARTLADLREAATVEEEDLLEALGYRQRQAQ